MNIQFVLTKNWRDGFVLDGDVPSGACKVSGIVAPDDAKALVVLSLDDGSDKASLSHFAQLKLACRQNHWPNLKAIMKKGGAGYLIGGSYIFFQEYEEDDELEELIGEGVVVDRQTQLGIDISSDTLNGDLPQVLKLPVLEEVLPQIMEVFAS